MTNQNNQIRCKITKSHQQTTKWNDITGPLSNIKFQKDKTDPLNALKVEVSEQQPGIEINQSETSNIGGLETPEGKNKYMEFCLNV